MNSPLLSRFARGALPVCLAALSAGAAATAITSPAALVGPTATIDFSQFTSTSGTSESDPVQIGGLIGANVTVDDTSDMGTVNPYNGTWLLADNGEWNSGRNGYLAFHLGGPDSPVRITFHDGPVSGFGLFMNYPTEPAFDYLPQTISAYDSGGALLETFDVGATAPISTPGGVNAGAFRGIQLATASIAYFELVGWLSVYDDLQFTTGAAQVPEPSSIALVGLALAGLGVARRRRA